MYLICHLYVLVMYDAIPVIVPIMFVIGIVGALVYERSRKTKK